MITSHEYERGIMGPISCTKFEKLLQTKDNPFPITRVEDFMVLGPYILETDGAFETEYMYERNKVLDCDYLDSAGGEANAMPYLGRKEKNSYFGEEYLKWEQGMIKWDQLRFDRDGYDTDKFFFATEQRNCVYYASFYVECEKDYDAVICYENSGSLLYLNGELIDNKPYGRVKGIKSMGNQVAVRFREGKNLVMFKLRVGYICDTFDLGMTNCTIYPVAGRFGDIGFTCPERTAAYFGSKENPRQVFPLFIGNFGEACGTSEACATTFKYETKGFSETIDIVKLESRHCATVRISVPVDEVGETVEVSATLGGCESKFFVATTPFCGFDGEEFIGSDFHFDTTYHQEQRTYALGAVYITKCIVDALMKNPDFKATLSEVDYLHPYYSIYPQHRQAIKRAFEEGRAEADCFYNQPNDLTSSGEGFVRNLIYGQLYHRDVLGRITSIYSPGDVFGHCNQLSQICAKGGVRVARWGKSICGLDAVFHHISPDGTNMIHDKCLDVGNAMRLGLKHGWESSEMLSTVAAYPQDGDTDWQKKTITNAHSCVFSEFDLGVVEDDKKQAEENGISKLEYSSRDLTQHHSGVLLTRTDFKQANRLCENLLVTAEKFSAIAAMYGAQYPEKALDKAWRQLVCAQHHDSVTGTNNEISFIDLMIEYREAIELAADIVNRATAFLASGVKIEDGEIPIFVFNPHPWKRKEPCKIVLPQYAKEGYALFDENENAYEFCVTGVADDGKSINADFIPTAQAMGYSTYVLRKHEQHYEIQNSSENTIENEYYRLTVDEQLGGGIVSIFDKKANREVIAAGPDGPANRVVVLREVPDRMETQHEIYTTGQKLYSTDFTARVESEKCSLYQKLTIHVKLDIIATVKQEITLYKDVERIDMKTTVEDYQYRDDLFTLTFPVDVKGGKTVFDDRFAPHITGKSKNKLSFQTHQHASYAHSRIVPANQWIELGTTVTAKINSGGNTGKINLGMTSVIRFDEKDIMLAANNLLCVLSKKAIPVTIFSDREQHGHTKVIHYNEDLTNTDTRFVLAVDGIENEYEKKLLSSLSSAQRKVLEDGMNKKGIAVLYTVDADNIFKKSIDVFLIKAKSINALNEYIQGIEKELECSCTFEISADVSDRELSVADDYGVALINTGTICCSVEGENMLNMMLFHTADFYGNQGKTTGIKQLVPEQKTHVFTYSLYPHSGDYRKAQVYKKAFEVNDGLFALNNVEPCGNKLLPKSKSFLECEGDFAVTAFKAGGYPMAQMKAQHGSIEERGLVIRGFETHGVKGRVKFKSCFELDEVAGVNLLEEEPKRIEHSQNAFDEEINSHSIETFKLKVKPCGEKIGFAQLGAQKEPVEPTYIRSWEHDLGSMPIGYLSVAGVIGRNVEKLSDLDFGLEISMANNHPDIGIKGEMRIGLSNGFKTDETIIPYALEANEVMSKKIVVTKPSADSKGIVRLNYEADGQRFEDVFEFGYFNPEVEVKIKENSICATVINLTGEDINGELSIATPFETWDMSGHNPCARGSVSPRTLKVDLKSGERVEYNFDTKFQKDDLLNSYWAVAKLMVNGRIHFGYDCVKGEVHNRWTHVFWNEAVEKNNGSLEKILRDN